jgi:hypothetical protein
MRRMPAKLKSIFNFYYEGFRNMPLWGRKMWAIILVKLFIMFAILKLFFFPDFLGSRYKTNEEKSNHVLEQLLKTTDNND